MLVGRDRELARLKGLVSPPYSGGRTLLLGEPGAGKTALLAAAADEARSAGMRVLTAIGRESEQDLAFAGLYQLLRPVLDRVQELPAREAQALRGAFGLSDDAVPPDVLLTGTSVLTLLSGLAEEQPLLIAGDDAQWLDRASLDALAFIACHPDAGPLVLLIGVRGSVPPAGFDRGFFRLVLPPLSPPDASRLLDAQPQRPRGPVREQVLAQAGGNPLALIELPRMAAADPQATRRWAAEPLPVTSRLTAIMTARYSALPRIARAALLLAATADSPDLTAHAADLTVTALAPAEHAGLIQVGASGPEFTHPLVRSAVYYGAPFADRAAAHLKVAEALRDQPDRYAWHLAAAALGTDEQVAGLLEQSAALACRRGGTAAAARAMERAAELSRRDRDKARRLLAAADLARLAGQADWVRELAEKVLTLTSEPELCLAARLKIGWSLLWSGQPGEAFETLLSVSAEAASSIPSLAWDAAAMAATIGHQTGLPEASVRVRTALDSLNTLGIDGPAPAPPSRGGRPASPYDEARMWIGICADPFGGRTETVPDLRRILSGTVSDLARVGGAAWSLDETELAIRVLRDALSQLRAPGIGGASGAVLSCLEWAYADSGRWDEALATACEAGDIAAAYRMQTVAASADLVTATVLALRGEHEQVPALLARALSSADETVYRGFAARIRYAAGLAALGQGQYAAAYGQLRQQFAADGTPLHYHFSYYAIADFAAAAARADQRLEARTRLEWALARLGSSPGPRLEQLVARARGLLAEPDEAGAHFAAGLRDPAGSTWPFERAQLQLDYGEWLRRQRRINEAKPVLTAARETFRRLGAAPWTRRAESELRACGVAGPPQPAARTSALDGLTPQQREIALLASRGLTNAEIAERLFLSPRTVASHLHRSYPKLGVAGRHQLRDLLDRAGTSQASS
jgi:DNA-binding CsgD family transcriptional regulator/tetratricopeptide (TPR) repeat protein